MIKKKRIIILFLFLFLSLIILIFLYRIHFFQDLEYLPSSEPLVNPLMGWAPWATIKTSQQPHTLVYADLTWRDFEPREGFYDFEYFESRNQFERWRQEGKRVVFRFVMDVPEYEQHLDIPDWLFEKIGGNGDFYNVDYSLGFSPDYSDPVLIDYHQKAIQALGERYGEDGFFAYIELGSLGHWGEWHVRSDSNIRQLPDEAIRDQYVRHYREAFPNTYLLMRRPFNIAAIENLGLYNDMSADLNATKEWLKWIKEGGGYSQTGEQNALSPLPDGWQKAPIGGEQSWAMSDSDIYLNYLDQTIMLMRASHTTFVGPGGPYDIQKDGPLQMGIDQVLTNIGYRIRVIKAHMPARVWFGDQISVSVEFINDGVAPFYYDWPVIMMLYDENNIQVASTALEMDLRQLLPNKPVKVIGQLPLSELEDGIYTIAVAVLDPLTMRPAVHFSVLDAGQDIVQKLGQFQINWLY